MSLEEQERIMGCVFILVSHFISGFMNYLLFILYLNYFSNYL